MNAVGRGEVDVLQQLLDLLNELKIYYCVIGGLAVNAYVEPVVSLDLDIVVATNDIDKLIKKARKLFKIKNSVTVSTSLVKSLTFGFNRRLTRVISHLYLVLQSWM